MEQQKKHDIALMKYAAIAPVISGLPAQYQSFSEYFREVSQKGILHPDGSLRHYATSTIAKWYGLYAKNGFDTRHCEEMAYAVSKLGRNLRAVCDRIWGQGKDCIAGRQ